MSTESKQAPTTWSDIIDQATFEALVIEATGLVVVAFEDHDCRHCREHRRLLQLTWRHLDLPLTTLRVDATRLPVLAQQYQILGYPTLLIFMDGQVVDRAPGRPSPADLLTRLRRVHSPSATAPSAGPESSDQVDPQDTIATASIPATGSE